MRSKSPVFVSPNSRVLRSPERKLRISVAGKGGRRSSSIAWITPFVANCIMLLDKSILFKKKKATHNIGFYYVSEKIDSEPM